MKNLIVLLIIFFGLCISYSNEKIIDFSFKVIGPLETRVYLKDENRKVESGYFSVRPMISYSESNYLLNSASFGTLSVYDKTTDTFKGKIDLMDMANLTSLYNYYRSYMISSIVLGSISVLSLSIGGALLGTSFFEESSTNWSLGATFDYSTNKYKIKKYEYLLTPGIAVLSCGGLFFLISACVLLPLTLYNNYLFNNLKKSLINIINGAEIKDKNKQSLLRLKFDILIG